ncbi:unnamed protein product [Periconia digitata]|uniref:Heterokaryon incompatibility domain-containing protein n=1 Tax=Periconia digitata TaxID=1303443 RepID=A0A9W4U8S8_9PLEO|nr:unnamed protein product [Periconia digitata]
MRLLNSATLEFEIFNEESLPEYLILSHTWGSEEVSFQDMRYLQRLKTLPEAMQQDAIVMFSLGLATGTSRVSKQDIESTAGYRKVVSTAKAAQDKDYKYFWIDTCCIDKTSSSELQEAINSMYRWYQEASLCIVVLEDVRVGGREYIADANFGYLVAQTRWITRGWTLQELIAPRRMHFVDADWQFLTTKSVASGELNAATGIPRYVLETGNMGNSSIAQKMSWAAHRTTTRLEDRAYSLLGIFGVNIPMLYGEGANAFARLQEEILRTTPDDSIFYWKLDTDCSATCRGLLAPSPSAFKDCGNVTAGPPVLVSNTNMGISLRLRFEGLMSSGKVPHSLGILNAKDGRLICAIMLHVLHRGLPGESGEFGKRCARVSTHAVNTHDIRKIKRYSTIYVSHRPQIPSRMFTAEAYCYRFHFPNERNRLAIGRTWPPARVTTTARWC